MTRTLAHIFALVALLVQLGAGVLHSDGLCKSCQPAASTEPAGQDSCCSKKPAKPRPATQRASHGSCHCCPAGCSECVRTPSPERAAVQQVREAAGTAVDLVGEPLPALRPVLWENLPVRTAWVAPRTTESPPGLDRIKATRLLV